MAHLHSNRIPLHIPFVDLDFRDWSIPILVIIAAFEIFGLSRRIGNSDHGAHVGGLIAGVVCAKLLKWQVSERTKKAEQMRREQGAFGGNASWREGAETKSDTHEQRPGSPLSGE